MPKMLLHSIEVRMYCALFFVTASLIYYYDLLKIQILIIRL